MPLTHRHKICFVHNPKAAGTSIQAALGIVNEDPQGILCGFYERQGFSTVYTQHYKASDIRQVKPKEFAGYFTFAVVRNPYERTVSAWQWYRKVHACEMSFKDFLTTNHEGNHNHPQTEFIEDDGRIIVDKVYRYEKLDEVWKDLRRCFGITHKPPHLNKTDRKHYSAYYDAETRALAEAMFGRDILLFDYHFEDER